VGKFDFEGEGIGQAAEGTAVSMIFRNPIVIRAGDELVTDEKRREREARRLTELLEAGESFSFLRLGDGEAKWIVRVQTGQMDPNQQKRLAAWNRRGARETVFSTSGWAFPVDQYDRLMGAYGNCTYLDYYDEPNKDTLPLLRLSRPPGAHRNPDANTSVILGTWCVTEMGRFLEGKRVLFYASEGPLLEELLRSAAFRELASGFIPPSAEIFCPPIPHHGEAYWRHLEEIKETLRAAITAFRPDVVFVSLGFAAKVLCHELAVECQCRMVDFGSQIRGLTYSASPPFAMAMASHSPFLYRVPLRLYMDAYRRAYPESMDDDLVVKLVGQVLRDLYPQQVGGTVPTDRANACLMAGEGLDAEKLDLFRDNLAYLHSVVRGLRPGRRGWEMLDHFYYILDRAGVHSLPIRFRFRRLRKRVADRLGRGLKSRGRS
jgi:hypothetical protein